MILVDPEVDTLRAFTRAVWLAGQAWTDWRRTRAQLHLTRAQAADQEVERLLPRVQAILGGGKIAARPDPAGSAP